MRKPEECPVCESSNIWRNLIDEDWNKKIFSVVCKSCGHHWKEIYRTELIEIKDDSAEVRQYCPRCHDWMGSCSISSVARVGDHKLQIHQICPHCGAHWDDTFEVKRIKEGEVH